MATEEYPTSVLGETLRDVSWKSLIWKWLATCEAVFLNYGKNILIIQSFRLLGITELTMHTCCSRRNRSFDLDS